MSINDPIEEVRRKLIRRAWFRELFKDAVFAFSGLVLVLLGATALLEWFGVY